MPSLLRPVVCIDSVIDYILSEKANFSASTMEFVRVVACELKGKGGGVAGRGTSRTMFILREVKSQCYSLSQNIARNTVWLYLVRTGP